MERHERRAGRGWQRRRPGIVAFAASPAVLIGSAGAEAATAVASPSHGPTACWVYAESLTGEEHLERILSEARELVSSALSAARGPR
jgi:hypothetical protein